MYIFLIIWFLFLFVYIVFNIYGIYRVMAMRIKGDIVPLAILVYLIAIFLVIAVAIILISSLDWGEKIKLFGLLGGNHG